MSAFVYAHEIEKIVITRRFHNGKRWFEVSFVDPSGDLHAFNVTAFTTDNVRFEYHDTNGDVWPFDPQDDLVREQEADR